MDEPSSRQAFWLHYQAAIIEKCVKVSLAAIRTMTVSEKYSLSEVDTKPRDNNWLHLQDSGHRRVVAAAEAGIVLIILKCCPSVAVQFESFRFQCHLPPNRALQGC